MDKKVFANSEVELAKSRVCTAIDQNTIFQEKVRQLMMDNEFEVLLDFLREQQQFVDEKFMMGTLGQSLGQYFMAMGNVVLKNYFPFLEELEGERTATTRFYYIGKNYYKAYTRKILELSLIQKTNYLGVGIKVLDHIQEEWLQLDQLKANKMDMLRKEETKQKEKELEYKTKVEDAITDHQRTLSDLRKKYHTLTSKVLKKQSDIDEVEKEIKKESQMIQDLSDHPETIFVTEYQELETMKKQVVKVQEEMSSMDLLKALVRQDLKIMKRENYTAEQFCNKIAELNLEWQGLMTEETKESK